MAIASASKWFYGAYVAQKRNGLLSASDIKFLTFQSGYTNFDTCLSTQSVGECVAYESNGVYYAATDGFFAYGGGHMENHASLSMGLGALFNAGLTSEIQSQIGTDVNMIYTQPQPAGGMATSAADYALFLRKVLSGQLQIAALLGTHAVCTNPATCAQALNTPVPASESWHYSIGHWVEDDPVVGDGAFSSAGAFGFYPWIDATKTWYGVVARRTAVPGEGFSSANCGREIRKAFVTGVTQ
jgi:CubicO group peptidase (beta-lactamase class C family)